MNNKQDVYKAVKEHLIIVLGLLLYAISWNVFIFPHQMAGGGATGICAIIMYATQGLLPDGVQHFFQDTLGMASVGGGIPISLSYFILNGVLLVVSVKEFGWKVSLRSILGVLVLSMWLWVPFRDIYENIAGKPLPIFDPFMSAILAGIFCGFGLALVFVNNGTSGGTDILAKVINKHRPVPLGRALLLCDVVVISASGFLPGAGLDRIVYGLIIMVVLSSTIDVYINGLRQSVQFFIFSPKYAEIADAITRQADRGVTLLDGQGWYSKQPVKVVTVMARKTESTQIFSIVKEIDPKAFISQSAALGVYGEGFDVIGQK